MSWSYEYIRIENILNCLSDGFLGNYHEMDRNKVLYVHLDVRVHDKWVEKKGYWKNEFRGHFTLLKRGHSWYGAQSERLFSPSPKELDWEFISSHDSCGTSSAVLWVDTILEKATEGWEERSYSTHFETTKAISIQELIGLQYRKRPYSAGIYYDGDDWNYSDFIHKWELEKMEAVAAAS